MKKFLAMTLAIVMALCLCVPAMAADTYTITLINGMDGSVHATYEVAAGEDFVFTISCSAPCDMGPVADGEEGAGVTTTVGAIAYSNITTGGPNAYPTAETVTISGINADATVTVTPNPGEVDALFPTITEGAAAASSASGEASGEASAEASDEPYPMFEEYKAYLFETMMQDSFWQSNEANLQAGLDAAETPYDESILNFTGSGDVDQAPSGIEFPMTYDAWYAENGGAAPAGGTDEAAYQAYLIAFVGSCEDIQTSGAAAEFIALIEAGDYVSFPVEMLFNEQWFGEAAMTYDQFVAAGGVYEIVDHASNGQMLDGETA